VRSNIVDPAWVPTRMGGPNATDDLALGHDTQVWLATTTDTEADVTGTYWYHRRVRPPAPAVHDRTFQDQLLATLAEITGSDTLALAEDGEALAPSVVRNGSTSTTA
jgi:hypothetical protein